MWAAVYPLDPWPTGLTVRWAGFMRGALGLADRFHRRKNRKRPWLAGKPAPYIVLNYADAKRYGCVEVLMHEFVHIRGCDRHGADFNRMENAARARLGLPAVAVCHGGGHALDENVRKQYLKEAAA